MGTFQLQSSVWSSYQGAAQQNSSTFQPSTNPIGPDHLLRLVEIGREECRVIFWEYLSGGLRVITNDRDPVDLENYPSGNLQDHRQTEDTAFPLQTTSKGSHSTETITTAGRGLQATPPQFPLQRLHHRSQRGHTEFSRAPHSTLPPIGHRAPPPLPRVESVSILVPSRLPVRFHLNTVSTKHSVRFTHHRSPAIRPLLP